MTEQLPAASWSQVEAQVPALAAAVRRCFAVRKHCTLATLRAGGAPRISGIEVEWAGGELWIGSMADALKARDLRRDPRMALHSPTVDPVDGDEAAWPGEAKVAGIAHEVPVTDGSHRFRLALTEVVHTAVGSPADHLVISSWHPGRGLEVRRRR
jgi:hypothetical protein